MSTIGINIKKIRKVKSLNQTEFANLFGLTRANIGSYEELRAEPKIDTIIKIATHFKISIDKLVRKEITVNEISNFDVFSSIPSKAEGKKQNEIKYISHAELKNYPKLKNDKKYTNSLETAYLPMTDNKTKSLIMYNNGNDLYTGKDSFMHGDQLFLESAKENENHYLGVLIDDQNIYKGFITKVENTYSIQPLNLNKKAKQVTLSNHIELWKLKGKFTFEINAQELEILKLKKLEKRLEELEKNAKTKLG